jgi:ribosomal protein L11 methyltransferase
MDYTQVDIRLDEVNPFADILVAMLNEIEFESYETYENGLKAYVQTQLLNINDLNDVLSQVTKLTDISFTINKIKQENWNAQWESNYPPVFINDTCVVRAHFHESFTDIKHEIIITPQMSFGTGHHQTTSLMMNRIFGLDIRNKSVLDMGSGTGILSILASKLGARDLVGIDFDEWAFKNAKENAVLNNVSNIHFIYGDSSDIQNMKYDIILANINMNIILSDLEIYVSAMQEDAEIILSGFLLKDTPRILSKSRQLGLNLVFSKNKNKWQMLHLKRA